MLKKNQLIDSQRQDYYTSYQLTRECLVYSISKLEIRNVDPSTSSGEVAENELKKLELVADKAFLDAKLAAFEAIRDAINPPSTQQLDLIKNLIAEVEQQNTNQRIVDELVILSTDVLTEFNHIHPTQTT